MKRTIPLNRILLGAFFCSSLGAAFTNIALGEEAIDKITETQPGKIVSDGSRIEIKKLGISITPPQGWEVISDHPTLSLIMQEPKIEKVQYDVAMYQRNITVAAIHEPAQIDEKRSQQLAEELTSTFGKQGGVENFQILDHKFFDYKAKNDGLVMFSSFKTGEFNMMQMHVLVSGETQQILLSYSDLQERFSAPETYGAAWNSMASVDVIGVPPMRYRNLVVGGGMAGLLFLGVCCLSFIRSRRARQSYLSDADEVYNDDEDFSFSSSSNNGTRKSANDFESPVTQSGVWDLRSQQAVSIPAKKHNNFASNEEKGLSFVTSF